MEITRRRVLIGLVSTATAAVEAEKRVPGAVPLGPASIASGLRPNLAAIGAAYVRQHVGTAGNGGRAGATTEALGQLGIERRLAATLLASGGGAQVSASVQSDFDCGRTTDVGGWVLSVTEVAVAVVAWSEDGQADAGGDGF